MLKRRICKVFGLSVITVSLLWYTFMYDGLIFHKFHKDTSIFNDTQPTAACKLIILTYMRSGSSFTGNIIQEHPDVFYVFEPLMTISNQFHGKIKDQIIQYADNSSINASWTGEGDPPLYIQSVKSIFNCRFDQLDYGTLKQNHMKNSKSTRDTIKCRSKKYPTETKWQRLLMCYQNVSSKCRDASIIAVKLIRLSMRQAQVLISSDPTVKVIHLIRDPRGVLKSRERLGRFNPKNAELESLQFCLRVLDDIEISKSISNTFSNRILTVRYEDIAESPIIAARQMYKFIGLEMTSHIENFIWNITYRGIEMKRFFSTFRSNATKTANNWRNSTQYDTVSSIQESCVDVFHKMGYRFFNSSDELNNFDISMKYKTYDPDLLKISI